jgi:hypothetical protein
LPCDELLLEDVVKPEVQAAYKCCIFLNAFYLTDAQTQAIEKLKRGGRTLVWLYAPGYVRDTGLSAKSVEAVTGLGVGVDPAPQTLAYRLPDRTHPITAGLEDKEYYGDRRPVAPRFCVTTPDATVLGVYADGKAAVALKDFGTHRSFYSAVPALPFPLLKNLLRYAGCHVYVNDEIYMDATKDFLLLTNSFDGPRTVAVSLPRPRDVSDLLTGRQVATGVTRFEAPMAPGETVLYRLR